MNEKERFQDGKKHGEGNGYRHVLTLWKVFTKMLANQRPESLREYDQSPPRPRAIDLRQGLCLWVSPQRAIILH